MQCIIDGWPVAVSQLTSEQWWTWIKACVVACIVRLIGFSCRHTLGSHYAPDQFSQRLVSNDPNQQWYTIFRWLRDSQTKDVGQGKCWCRIHAAHEQVKGPCHWASLLAAAAPHSGDWLHTVPISACGLHLAIRVAVSLRLGCALCEAHPCPCGNT